MLRDRGYVILLFFSLTTAFVTLLGLSIKTDRREKQQLTVLTPTLFNAGSATDGFTVRLEVANPSEQTLHVFETTTSCDCMSVAPTQFSLLPGESTSLTVVLDLSLPPSQAHLLKSEFAASLILDYSVNNGSRAKQVIPIGGIVHNPFPLIDGSLELEVDNSNAGASGTPIANWEFANSTAAKIEKVLVDKSSGSSLAASVHGNDGKQVRGLDCVKLASTLQYRYDGTQPIFLLANRRGA